MTEPLRVGILGLTHDHVWDILEDMESCEGVKLVAAADPHEPLRKQIAEKYGAKTYKSYDDLVEHKGVDAVYVYCDNATGPDLVELAALRGLHVLVEKPLAESLESANRMIAAVRRAGVRMMVNWPFAWWPQLQHALQLVAEGRIGQVWEVKYRAAHAGPRELGCSEFFCDWLYDPDLNGGGALIDYCCYGALLARLLLGLPSRVSAVAGRLAKDDITVEDNGVIVMTYPHALAIAEGSWSQIGKLTAYTPTFFGTQGTLLVEPRPGGRLILATAEEPEGAVLPVPEPPAHRRSANRHFAHCLATGEEFQSLCSDRMARDAQEIVEAGQLSVKAGGQVSLPL